MVHLMDTTRSFSIVEGAFYSLNWVHKLTDLPNPIDHYLPVLIKEAAKRKLGRPCDRKDPISTATMSRIIAKYAGSDSLIDFRFLTMCVLAFSGFLRFNDLINLKLADFLFHEDHLKITIRKSKTDVYSIGQTVILAKTDSVGCPVKTLSKYFSLAKLNFARDCDLFVFRSIVGKGRKAKLSPRNVPLSYSRSRELLKSYLKSFNLNPNSFGLHSFRIGGATAAARNGVSHSSIKAHGRWKTDSAKDLYVRRNSAEQMLVSKSLNL